MKNVITHYLLENKRNIMAFHQFLIVCSPNTLSIYLQANLLSVLPSSFRLSLLSVFLVCSFCFQNSLISSSCDSSAFQCHQRVYLHFFAPCSHPITPKHMLQCNLPLFQYKSAEKCLPNHLSYSTI